MNPADVAAALVRRWFELSIAAGGSHQLVVWYNAGSGAIEMSIVAESADIKQPVIVYMEELPSNLNHIDLDYLLEPLWQAALND